MADKRRKRSKKIRRRTYYLLWRMTVSIMAIIIGIAWLSQMTFSQAAEKNHEEDSREEEAEMEAMVKDAVEEDLSALSDSEREIAEYANAKGYYIRDYTDKLVELYEKNQEARQFVLDYPFKKDIEYDIDLSEYKNADFVPLLMQWDERWGYGEYAGDVLGLTGCGPTCLSMVAIYLTGNDTMNPKWMADFSTQHDFYEEGNGTRWALMSEGAAILGLNSKEIPLDKERMIDNLQAGNPIICILGPGDFTNSGHFIVLTGYRDGGFTLNDPNSRINSEKTWSFEELQYQIRNLWVYWK
ncbi:MAG: C39 family peptidase [Lachnospiraceae bacterium]|nr:C39 family peptidase [Lachnospiraceae bacterium]